MTAVIGTHQAHCQNLVRTMFPAAVLAAALLGTPRLCRWAPDVPSDAEPLFDLERSAFGPRAPRAVRWWRDWEDRGARWRRWRELRDVRNPRELTARLTTVVEEATSPSV